MPRTPLIAANWKMHAPPVDWDSDDSPYRPREGIDVVVFPSMLDVRVCLEKFLVVGGQCGRPEGQGSFTGDVSMELLAAHGCTWVLCGHSERRLHHDEHDAFVAAQAEAAVKAGLHPIVCIGETEEERAVKRQHSVLEKQLGAVAHVNEITIAYEPLWAIGNGHTAGAEEAQETHAFIRSLLPKDRQDTTRILYGGSVTPNNGKELLDQPDIDGLLIGTSSLDPAAFARIVTFAAA